MKSPIWTNPIRSIGSRIENMFKDTNNFITIKLLWMNFQFYMKYIEDINIDNKLAKSKCILEYSKTDFPLRFNYIKNEYELMKKKNKKIYVMYVLNIVDEIIPDYLEPTIETIYNNSIKDYTYIFSCKTTINKLPLDIIRLIEISQDNRDKYVIIVGFKTYSIEQLKDQFTSKSIELVPKSKNLR